MIVDGLNSEEDGTCRTLKGRYAKTSAANFDRGNTFGASGVVETSVQLGFMDNGTGQHQSNTVYAENALCPNITTIQGGGTQQIKVESRYRIRKLTPIECWRLMDFSDEDFHKAEQVNSNSQLYKEAGNSIVCNVLVAIFGQLIVGKEDEYKKINESEVQT
jgi:site-specific DNA-cytosine methylase